MSLVAIATAATLAARFFDSADYLTRVATTPNGIRDRGAPQDTVPPGIAMEAAHIW